MNHFRYLSVFVSIFLLSIFSGHAHGQAGEQVDGDSTPKITGLWRVEPERTNQANAESRKGMRPEMVDTLNSMTLRLKDDGQFKQTMGPAHVITGQWKFEFSNSANEGAGKLGGNLVLVPDNLEGHADMQFEIEFVTVDLMEANPPRGQGTVFFQRDQESDTEPEQGNEGEPQKQEKDRAAEMFANVPGCLGARSMEKDGVQISFVWFEDREAVVAWCKSQKHMQTAETVLKMADPDINMREPLEAAPDEQGPFLVIVTVKPKADRGEGFPLEQLSMEIYKPVEGGMFLGDRFAPKAFEVGGLKEITPKDR